MEEQGVNEHLQTQNHLQMSTQCDFEFFSAQDRKFQLSLNRSLDRSCFIYSMF